MSTKISLQDLKAAVAVLVYSVREHPDISVMQLETGKRNGLSISFFTDDAKHTGFGADAFAALDELYEGLPKEMRGACDCGGACGGACDCGGACED